MVSADASCVRRLLLTPSLEFLSLLKQHHDSGASLWTPWRLRTCLADAAKWEEILRQPLDADSERPLPASTSTCKGRRIRYFAVLCHFSLRPCGCLTLCIYQKVPREIPGSCPVPASGQYLALSRKSFKLSVWARCSNSIVTTVGPSQMR